MYFFVLPIKLLLFEAAVVLLLLLCIIMEVHTNDLTQMNCFSSFHAASK